MPDLKTHKHRDNRLGDRLFHVEFSILMHIFRLCMPNQVCLIHFEEYQKSECKKDWIHHGIHGI